MANQLINQITDAEKQAEQLLQKAQREARDIVKSVEEASTASQRAAAQENRQESMRSVEKARNEIAKELDAEKAEKLKAYEQMQDKARFNLDAASRLIVERVVQYGNR